MKLRLHILSSLLILFVGIQAANAQNGSFPWGIGAGARMLAYQAHPGQASLGASLYDPVGTVYLGRYLNSAFDFRTQANFGPAVRFPVAEGGTVDTWMVDMSYLMVFKLHNGLILPESFPVSAYLMAGVGGSYVPNHPDAFFPVGAGIRVRFSPRMSLNIETTRQLSLNGDYQHLAHALSFVYNLGANPDESVPSEADAEEMLTLVSVDTDGDGVNDDEDLCPDEAGSKQLQGCPDYEPEESAFEEEDSYTFNEQVEEVEDFGQEPMGTATEIDFTSEGGESGALAPCETLAQASLPTLIFGVGSDEISPQIQRDLDAIATKLKDCESVSLVLRGYTGDMGTERENKVLSVMRAYRVKYYLVYEHGISQVRITSNGLTASGSSSGDDEQGRRVEMELIF